MEGEFCFNDQTDHFGYWFWTIGFYFKFFFFLLKRDSLSSCQKDIHILDIQKRLKISNLI